MCPVQKGAKKLACYQVHSSVYRGGPLTSIVKKWRHPKEISSPPGPLKCVEGSPWHRNPSTSMNGTGRQRKANIAWKGYNMVKMVLPKKGDNVWCKLWVQQQPLLTARMIYLTRQMPEERKCQRGRKNWLTNIDTPNDILQNKFEFLKSCYICSSWEIA